MPGRVVKAACALAVTLAIAAFAAPGARADHSGPLAGEWRLDTKLPLGGAAEGTVDSSGHGLTAAAAGQVGLSSGGRFGQNQPTSVMKIGNAP